MSDDTHAPDGAGTGRDVPLDPAEARARELLELWGSQEPTASAGFALTIVRRARQQRAVVRPLRVIGEVLAATFEVARGLLRPSEGRQRP